MKTYDLWGSPLPAVQPTKAEEDDTVPYLDTGYPLYVVTAGTNKLGRQLYLCTFRDCDDWIVSVIPVKMTRARAEYMIDKCKKDMQKKNERSRIKIALTFPDFQIVRFKDLNLDL